MKILTVTDDAGMRQALHAALNGHDLTDIAVGDGQAVAPREAFDCVILDAAIDDDLRGRIATVRRALSAYAYIIALVLDGMDAANAPWRTSVNAVLTYPLHPTAVDAVFGDLRRLQATVSHLGDRSEDFPSAGGIISRSAFNQIFLSGMDRAGRYAERPSMLFFRIANFSEILKLDDTLAADELAALLAQLLTRVRRQSDIIAQTGRGEFCILLQRPQTETETVEAARRFADSLAQADLNTGLLTDVPDDIELFELPSGSIAARHRVTYASARP